MEYGFIKTVMLTKLIMTGGFGEGNENSDAYVGMIYAVSLGVPGKYIYIEEKSTITQENLENAKEIMSRKRLKTAIIVSDPLHMKRAMLMAKDYEIDAFSSPTPTSMYKSTDKRLKFLSRELFFYIGYKIYRIFN